MAKSSTELEDDMADPRHLRVVAPDPASDSLRAFAQALTATVREPVIVLDGDLRILAASSTYRRLFKPGAAEAAHTPFCQVTSPHWDPAVAELLRRVLTQHIAIDDHEIEFDLPAIGKRHMLLNAHPVDDNRGHGIAIVVGLEDLTAKQEIEGLRVALVKSQEMHLLEVHHRVANSLQIIASILLLKARAVQSQEIRSHLHDIHHRLLSVATVQRQLSVSTPGTDIELGPYLMLLCEGLASSLIGDDQGITIEASATEGTIKSEDAVSFGLIVTELVINSIKHGFPGGRKGRIVVAYVLDGTGWRLTVFDDGVGRAPGAPARTGLGTSIVEALARSMKANVEISQSGSGAATTIVHAA
jgi:two-component sensor histidine kinase